PAAARGAAAASRDGAARGHATLRGRPPHPRSRGWGMGARCTSRREVGVLPNAHTSRAVAIAASLGKGIATCLGYAGFARMLANWSRSVHDRCLGPRPWPGPAPRPQGRPRTAPSWPQGPFAMPQQFGEYRLLRLMGEGGMAQVWSAQRQTLGGPMSCAVKIIRPCHADDPHYREMFQREARLSLALSGHGNVVTVFDMGVHEGRAYLAMELVDGVTLAELSRRVGTPWPVANAVYVVAGVLRALCHIHGHTIDGEPQGIVHRDVTPHNVMISSRGEVKLMDFGIAQRSDAEPCLGGALGKLAYVPREQVEGDPDQRADLYAAGALLFELLDGRRFRWHCADEDAFFLEIYRDRVPTLRRKDVPAAVMAVLRGLLQPYREHRIATAAEALRMLEAW